MHVWFLRSLERPLEASQDLPRPLRDFEGLEKPLKTLEGLEKLRRWFEAVLEVQEKARGKARQPKDPRIANRIPPEPF